MTTPVLEVLGESSWRVTAKINGIDAGVWDSLDGGDTQFNTGTYTPSGGGQQVPVRGSRQTTDDLTLTRGFFAADWDLLNFIVGLGKGVRVDLSQAITDELGIPDPGFKPATATGRLKSVQRPKVKSDSDGASMLGMVVTAVRWAKTPTGFGA
jgi:hypothetical protein